MPADDRAGLERLARYLLRSPVSFERLKVGEHALAIADAARIRPAHKPHTASEAVDPKDLLAPVVMHIPENRRHVIRYYGAHSSVVRARRRHLARAVAGPPRAPEPLAAGVLADPDLRALRRRWPELLRRIFVVDLLVCPRCGATTRIIAFITQPRVIGTILKHLAAKGLDARSLPTAHTDTEAA
ncbi:MAG TPA: transposase [Thermoanaerobaculaceae bacterium]|nr:transposase [Thermoanaerobaculaceae bacterium]HQU34541.1 transposase [Thermoanaerobaculaceae bacterium]